MRRIGRFLHVISFSLLERRYLGGWVVGGMVIVMLDKSSLPARESEHVRAHLITRILTSYSRRRPPAPNQTNRVEVKEEGKIIIYSTPYLNFRIRRHNNPTTVRNPLYSP